MPQPKQAHAKDIADKIKVQHAEARQDREVLGSDMLNAVMTVPGISDVFASPESRDMLKMQLASLVENAIRMELDRQAAEADMQARMAQESNGQ